MKVPPERPCTDFVSVEEDGQVIEQADNHSEEEAEQGAADREAQQERQEPRDELPEEVREAAARSLRHHVLGRKRTRVKYV